MVAMRDVVGLREGEEVLIVTNFEATYSRWPGPSSTSPES